MTIYSDMETALPKFQSIPRHQVPKGRDGKHKKFMLELLSDLNQLASGHALKVPLAALPDVKENIRAALIRATRQSGLHVATSSDDESLYIWKEDSGA
jgi:hypothetical protein